MLGILAQVAGPMGGYSIGQFLIAVVVIAACVAIVMVAVRYFGIVIPQWAISIFWIVIVAAVAIFAIRYVLTM